MKATDLFVKARFGVPICDVGPLKGAAKCSQRLDRGARL